MAATVSRKVQGDVEIEKCLFCGVFFRQRSADAYPEVVFSQDRNISGADPRDHPQ